MYRLLSNQLHFADRKVRKAQLNTFNPFICARALRYIVNYKRKEQYWSLILYYRHVDSQSACIYNRSILTHPERSRQTARSSVKANYLFLSSSLFLPLFLSNIKAIIKKRRPSSSRSLRRVPPDGFGLPGPLKGPTTAIVIVTVTVRGSSNYCENFVRSRAKVLFGPAPRSPCGTSPSPWGPSHSDVAVGSTVAPVPRGSCRGAHRRRRAPARMRQPVSPACRWHPLSGSWCYSVEACNRLLATHANNARVIELWHMELLRYGAARIAQGIAWAFARWRNERTRLLLEKAKRWINFAIIHGIHRVDLIGMEEKKILSSTARVKLPSTFHNCANVDGKIL